MIPPLRMIAKGTAISDIKVLGIDSWCPTSRLAWKRSDWWKAAETTGEGPQEAEIALFAAGNGFHKVSVGLADLTESSAATPVTWGFPWS